MVNAVFYTIVIELVVCCLYKKSTDNKLILNVILVNIFTNLLLNSLAVSIIDPLWTFMPDIHIYVYELIIFVGEALIYWLLCNQTKEDAFKMSLLANLCSFVIGLIIL